MRRERKKREVREKKRILSEWNMGPEGGGGRRKTAIVRERGGHSDPY